LSVIVPYVPPMYWQYLTWQKKPGYQIFAIAHMKDSFGLLRAQGSRYFGYPLSWASCKNLSHEIFYCVYHQKTTRTFISISDAILHQLCWCLHWELDLILFHGCLFFFFTVKKIKPKSLYMLGNYSITELHPSPPLFVLANGYSDCQKGQSQVCTLPLKYHYVSGHELCNPIFHLPHLTSHFTTF
jgi:hypothetical protein